jgi:hypothetical protein
MMRASPILPDVTSDEVCSNANTQRRMEADQKQEYFEHSSPDFTPRRVLEEPALEGEYTAPAALEP